MGPTGVHKIADVQEINFEKMGDALLILDYAQDYLIRYVVSPVKKKGDLKGGLGGE